MAKGFTKDELSNIISFHRILLETLSGIVDDERNYYNDIKRLADKISASRSFDKIVMRYISENENNNLPPDAFRLVKTVYLFSKMQTVASDAYQVLGAHEKEIRQLIETAKRGKSSVRWMFTSSKKKEMITGSVETLRAEMQSSYVLNAQEIIGEAEIVRSADDETVWTEYNDEVQRKNLRSAFTKCTEGSNEPLILEIAALIDDFNMLSQQIDEAHLKRQELEKNIEDAGMKLVGREALTVLSDISVDEVNRESKGIRVTSLKKAGYNTIADIYAASEYELEAVYGISESRAFELKRIAQKIARDSYKSAKLRLSTDSKTAESTHLVTLIYSYRLYNAKIKELNDHSDLTQAEVQRSVRILSKLGRAVNWLFYTDEDKDAVADSCKRLEQLRTQGYIDNVRLILSMISAASSNADSIAAWKDFEQNSIQYYNILEKLLPGMLGDQNAMYGLPEELANDIQDQSYFPDGLLCELRNYQVWGVKYTLHQERVLLGDEMGLGKTVQAIASMVSLRNTNETHFVVVCPASVLTNWCREIRKHSKLRVIKVHGNDRTSALRHWKDSGGVAVTTYETTAYFKLEDDFHFGMCVVDEAHYIKNPNAKRTVNVKALCQHTDRLLFMTGTALENRVDEMINLIGILRPRIANEVAPIAYMSTAPQFRDKIAPVYFRRKREDVLAELPELIVSEEWCDMTPEEEEIYEKTVFSRNFNAMRRISWNVSDLSCSSKAQRMKELIEEAASEERKVLVFSFYRDTIKNICIMLDSDCIGPITGDVSPAQRQEIVDSFEKAPVGTVLVSQIQAGGTGLNIQSASVVILCEPQVKPSIENQAISRAYRMGQTRNVLVYKLLCDDSVDERMVEMLREKQQAFDAFADESAAAKESIELDSASFNTIINAEIERINSSKKS